ncbi:MAG TPA: hypothetical protein VND68_03455 [Chloroflexia bacterium]|jgi:hypothetical protein|nr:hypothetical protein [Chloroflexia bacterium]
MNAQDPHLPPGEYHRWGLHTPLALKHGPKRPPGVSILALVFWIAAAFFGLAFVLAFVPFTPGINLPGQAASPGYSAFPRAVEGAQGSAVTTSADTPTQIAIALVLAVVFGIAGYGLARLRPWGRIAAPAVPVATAILLVLAGVLEPLSGGVLALLVLSAGIMAYMLSRNVAAAFDEAGGKWTSRQVQ